MKKIILGDNAEVVPTRLLARLSGQLEITEAAIVRSAPWRRLMDLLDAVHAKHPEAAKAWAAALRETDEA